VRLRAAKVENYKSITDSGSFRVDDLTCLVGKNESGKTAVLRALHRLHPDDADESDFDVELEYPRQELFDYKPRHASNPDKVITTWWDLDDDDVAWISDQFGPGVVNESGQVTIARGYDNVNRWGLPVDEAAAVNNLIKDSGLDEADTQKLVGVSRVRDLIDQVTGLDEGARKTAFQERLTNLVGDGDFLRAVSRHLNEELPTFVYYANYHALPGEMSLERFVQLESQQNLTWPEKIFRALLALVGSSAQDISQRQTYESLKADLEAIGLRLSREIFNYWSQNRDLEVEFNFDIARPGDPPPFNSGYIFRTRIKNKRHGVSVNFDERSTGFVWFFSFLVWFSQMEREHGDRLVLLLDEPGLSLHGTAQADLLRYIRERLVSKYQVIYTTHSPFMADVENLPSVRTVEDVTADDRVLGTKVSDEVLSTDAETLFPLRAALGYDVTQSMFIGEHSLLVEGPSDLLYLKWASAELKDRGRTSLDRRWTITPCGGIRKIGSFLSLFGAQHLHVAVFSDFADGERGELRTLRERGLLRDGHVLTADIFTDQVEADMEDMLGRPLYVALVNRAYGLTAMQAVKLAKSVDAPTRVVKEVENHFKLLPASVAEFDHFRPAEYLTAHRSDFGEVAGMREALDRFERLFAALNSFLP
jgi:hypothetical protein